MNEDVEIIGEFDIGEAISIVDKEVQEEKKEKSREVTKIDTSQQESSSNKKKRTFSALSTEDLWYRLQRRCFLPLAVMRLYLDGAKSEADARY